MECVKHLGLPIQEHIGQPHMFALRYIGEDGEVIIPPQPLTHVVMNLAIVRRPTIVPFDGIETLLQCAPAPIVIHPTDNMAVEFNRWALRIAERSRRGPGNVMWHHPLDLDLFAAALSGGYISDALLVPVDDMPRGEVLLGYAGRSPFDVGLVISQDQQTGELVCASDVATPSYFVRLRIA